MAYGTVRQSYETAMFTEASSLADIVALLDDASFKASEGQLNYPPTEGKANYKITLVIEPMS